MREEENRARNRARAIGEQSESKARAARAHFEHISFRASFSALPFASSLSILSCGPPGWFPALLFEGPFREPFRYHFGSNFGVIFRIFFVTFPLLNWHFRVPMSVQFLNTVFYDFYTNFGALLRNFFVTFSLLNVTLWKHRFLRTSHAKSRFLGSQGS